MNKYLIVLADDHVLMREGIKQLINAVPGIEVVGEAGDSMELLKLLKKIRPHLVILDIAMPGMRGLEAAQEIRTLYPEVDVLFLSMHKSREFLALALATGAKGYSSRKTRAASWLRPFKRSAAAGRICPPN